MGSSTGENLPQARSEASCRAREARWPAKLLRSSLFAASWWMVALALVLSLVLWCLIGFAIHGYWTWGLGPGESTRADAVRIVLTMVAGVGGIIYLTIAYRRQRGVEAADFVNQLENAARQLGSTEPMVQYAGIYALEALADENEAERKQLCVDVLCGYLRLPYQGGGGPSLLKEIVEKHSWTDGRRNVEEIRVLQLRPADREIRLSIIRMISKHLQRDSPKSWSGLDLDFTGVVFGGGDFSRAVFSGGAVSFKEAEFSGGTVLFNDVEFSAGDVSFEGSEFSGADVSFEGAMFSGGEVIFKDAKFLDGKLTFSGAKFSAGTVTFGKAEFRGGKVIFAGTTLVASADFSGGNVSFDRATFSGAEVFFGVDGYFGTEAYLDNEVSVGGLILPGELVVDRGAVFSGGTVSFDRASVLGGKVFFGRTEYCAGRVSFDRARFIGGYVVFDGTKISGGQVSFANASFSGSTVTFDGVSLSGGTVSFRSAGFTSGAVSFSCAEFAGTEVDFAEAGFSDADVAFVNAKFSSGKVDFSNPTTWIKAPKMDWDDPETEVSKPECVQPDRWPPDVKGSDR